MRARAVSQLERLDGWVARRNEIAALLPRAAGRRGAGRRCRPRRRQGSLHGYHLFVVRVRDGRRGAPRGVRGACARRASACRCTTSRSTGCRTTATRSATRRTSARPPRSYYAGAISLPMFPAHDATPTCERVVRRAASGAAVSRSGARFEIGGTAGRAGGARCYVIAEAGANHNRDLGVARELIDVAADAGADAVKFQTYSGAAIYSSKTPRFEYLDDDRSPAGAAGGDRAAARVAARAGRARARRAASTSSPARSTTRPSTGCAALGVPAMKIASFEIVDLPLIRKAAAAGVPLILSTGMATYGEIEDALGAVAAAGNDEVALLRCASVYPSPPEIMNLRAMETMRDAFGVPVGLSDHTTGISVAAGAAALGVELLEKHFTLVARDGGAGPPVRAGARRAEGDGRGACARWRRRSATAASRARRRPRRDGDVHARAPQRDRGARHPRRAPRSRARCSRSSGRATASRPSTSTSGRPPRARRHRVRRRDHVGDGLSQRAQSPRASPASRQVTGSSGRSSSDTSCADQLQVVRGVHAPVEVRTVLVDLDRPQQEEVRPLAVGEPASRARAASAEVRQLVDALERIASRAPRVEPAGDRCGAARSRRSRSARRPSASALTTRSTTAGSSSGQSPVMRTTTSAPASRAAPRKRASTSSSGAAVTAARPPRSATSHERRRPPRSTVVASTTSSTPAAAAAGAACARSAGCPPTSSAPSRAGASSPCAPGPRRRRSRCASRRPSR